MRPAVNPTASHTAVGARIDRCVAELSLSAAVKLDVFRERERAREPAAVETCVCVVRR